MTADKQPSSETMTLWQVRGLLNDMIHCQVSADRFMLMHMRTAIDAYLSAEHRERDGYRWKPIETLSEDIDFFACQLSSYTSTYLEIGGGYSFEGKIRAFNAFGESFKPSHWMELPAAPDGEST